MSTANLSRDKGLLVPGVEHRLALRDDMETWSRGSCESDGALVKCCWPVSEVLRLFQRSATRATYEARPIVAVLRGMRTGDSASDLEKGAAVNARNRPGRYFLPRPMIEQLRRSARAQFTTTEFYKELSALGCESLASIRLGRWHGRAWFAPNELFALDTIKEDT